MVMKEVKIAEFKSKLSSHLKEVRRGGEVVIFDRDHPVAKVVPFQQSGDFACHPAKIKKGLKRLRFSGIKAKFEVVQLLREDRDKR